MSKLLANNYRFRRSFAKNPAAIDFDNLIAIQLRSYEEFLQANIPSHKRNPKVGLESVFRSVFPIQDFKREKELQYVSYELEEPKYDVDECREKGQSYVAQLKVTVNLSTYILSPESDELEFASAIQEEVFFCDLPLMTENGTFIINGTERVIVSQLYRSPGVFFARKKLKNTSGIREVLSARIIPNRGSWIDFEFDAKDHLYVQIDRRRKLPATILLRALGYGIEDLMSYFYDIERVFCKEVKGQLKWFKETPLELLKIQRATGSIYKKSKVVHELNVGDRIKKRDFKKIQKHAETVKRTVLGIEKEVEVVLMECERTYLFPNSSRDADENKDAWPRMYSANAILGEGETYQVVDDDFQVREVTEGEGVIIAANERLTEDAIERAIGAGITEFFTVRIDNKLISPALRDTLQIDKIDERPDLEKGEETPIDQAKIQIFRHLRPSDPATAENASKYFDRLLNETRYDLSRVGRMKLNHKLYKSQGDEQYAPDDEMTVLQDEDLLRVVKYICDLKNNKPNVEVDDIDHLGNRRIRAVGELMENQFRTGLVRMEKTIKEKMGLNEKAGSVQDIINAKPVNASVKEFFSSSQLSQFMDQTNPLSEVTHKRRLSALGPGGLTRERAGSEVRDVHPTHYGRICPVETPEGPNVGLIASLASFARVNQHGFIETPYRKVENGKVTNDIEYYMALDERGQRIVEAATELDKDGNLANDFVTARKDGDVLLFNKEDVNLMDVGANQMVSVAASLVPFLENDDANRALMGSNMQRQAVPLVRTRSPLVGTSMEKTVARDSGVCTRARRSGIITDVDSKRIVLQATEMDGDIGGDVEIYNLTKFRRSNQSTCINQRPLVRIGDKVEVGDIIADGPATQYGELALGQNPVVAFMPWQGYNFEDSILISERLVQEDVYTSIHIEEFEVSARDTKLGPEKITNDIPGVGDEKRRNLDESGVVRVGAYVRPGDILVGKITPEGERQLTGEERLVRNVFGEKADERKDSSLKAKPGCEGIVIHADVFHRDSEQKDDRAKEIAKDKEEQIRRDLNQKCRVLRQSAKRKLIHLLEGEKVKKAYKNSANEEIVSKGDILTVDQLSKLGLDEFENLDYVNADISPEIWDIVDTVADKTRALERRHEEKIERLSKGDDLPPGIIKKVIVYVAIKRKLQVGDKMAGRHGNKGVVSRVMPVENMPYLEDGTPVDVVLNPLGVPSRMNVGQVLETHLGWAARGLGYKLQAMIQEGRDAEEVRQYLLAIYKNSPEMCTLLKDATYDELKVLGQKYKEGVTLATPVFDGASESEIKEYLRLAGLDDDGQTVLFDGRTGEPFANKVTVGVMYVLKLHHLVDEKLHARSTGPYSLVTQQPLGGKAQSGGQRLGEMEVWALEAYGAAYSLQEMLTVKSDDIQGRNRMYESIVKGDYRLEPGIPESFKVLMQELKALALNVTLLDKTEMLKK